MFFSGIRWAAWLALLWFACACGGDDGGGGGGQDASRTPGTTNDGGSQVGGGDGDATGAGDGDSAGDGDGDGDGDSVGDGDGDGDGDADGSGDGDGDSSGDGDGDGDGSGDGDGDGSGDGDGDSSGDGDGDGSGDGDGDTTACVATPARLLILFDISGSMMDNFDGTSRMEAAMLAVNDGLSGVDPALQVGALYFPTDVCIATFPATVPVVEAFDAAPHLPFQALDTFLTSWAATPSVATMVGGLGTPMQEAFDRADGALGDLSTAPPTAVLVVTDGDGNCFPDEAVTGPTMLEVEHATRWAEHGVATWIVDLGMPDPPAVVLDQIAAAGTTTRTQVTTFLELVTAVQEAIDSVGCR